MVGKGGWPRAGLQSLLPAPRRRPPHVCVAFLPLPLSPWGRSHELWACRGRTPTPRGTGRPAPLHTRGPAVGDGGGQHHQVLLSHTVFQSHLHICLLCEVESELYFLYCVFHFTEFPILFFLLTKRMMSPECSLKVLHPQSPVAAAWDSFSSQRVRGPDRCVACVSFLLRSQARSAFPGPVFFVFVPRFSGVLGSQKEDVHEELIHILCLEMSLFSPLCWWVVRLGIELQVSRRVSTELWRCAADTCSFDARNPFVPLWEFLKSSLCPWKFEKFSKEII